MNNSNVEEWLFKIYVSFIICCAGIICYFTPIDGEDFEDWFIYFHNIILPILTLPSILFMSWGLIKIKEYETKNGER